MYAGCPIYWCSQLQTEVTLSMTEAEYMALSHSMRKVLPFLNLMKEINKIFPLHQSQPNFFCTVWEDNCSCIKVAKSPKFMHQTKHISLKYHHFCQFVTKGTIKINHIGMRKQIADIFTKPLDEKQFVYLRKKLCRW